MIVRNILDRKGGEVLLAARDATITDTVATMCEKGVGSALVLGDDGLPAGILTERDVMRQFAKHGADLGGLRVGDVMSAPVRTVGPDATVDSVMQLMTRHRFRHVPIVHDGKLVGIVSIGDVVKTRLEETEFEAESLRHYISNSY